MSPYSTSPVVELQRAQKTIAERDAEIVRLRAQLAEADSRWITQMQVNEMIRAELKNFLDRHE